MLGGSGKCLFNLPRSRGLDRRDAGANRLTQVQVGPAREPAATDGRSTRTADHAARTSRIDHRCQFTWQWEHRVGRKILRLMLTERGLGRVMPPKSVWQPLALKPSVAAMPANQIRLLAMAVPPSVRRTTGR